MIAALHSRRLLYVRPFVLRGVRRSATETISSEGRFLSAIDEERVIREPFGVHTIPAREVPFHDETQTFQSIGIESSLAKGLAKIKIFKPSRIQARAIPEILGGKTCLIGSETGSGKTLTYLLPIAQSWLKHPKGDANSSSVHEEHESKDMTNVSSEISHTVEDQVSNLLESPKSKIREWKQPEAPFALILTPRKELCAQIAEVARGVHPQLASAIFSLEEKDQTYGIPPYSISIFTPGMMKSSLQYLNPTKRSDFSWLYASLRYVVFDEVDMLLDEGFREQIETIVKQVQKINPAAQFLFVGATIPRSGPKSAVPFIRKRFPDVSEIESADLHFPVPSVTQHFINIMSSQESAERLPVVDVQRKKRNAIAFVLQKIFPEADSSAKVLIFANTKVNAEKAAKTIETLSRKPTLLVTADMKEGKREEAMRQFRKLRSVILVCTDITARGLDIPNITHVIQYDFALSAIQYLHRIGRTGRAGKSGEAYGLVSPSDELLATKIISTRTEFTRLFSRGRSLTRNHKRALKRKRPTEANNTEHSDEPMDEEVEDDEQDSDDEVK